MAFPLCRRVRARGTIANLCNQALAAAQTRAERETGSKDPAAEPNGVAVQQVEVLVRGAIYKPTNALMGFLLQGAADRIDASYQPKPGQHYKGRASLQVDGIFGSFKLERDYYYHEGKKQGHYPPMQRWAWRWAAHPRWRV